MERKNIVVLANSWKKGGRCLAGKEVRLSGGSIQGFGAWIRPISPGAIESKENSEGGQVTEQTMRRSLNRQGLPEILEIVEIPLKELVGLPDQPENWWIAEGEAWRTIGGCPRECLSALTDAPAELWDTSGRGWNRVEEWLPKGAGFASLYLVASEGAISAEIGSRPKTKGSTQLKLYKTLKLPYGDRVHDFTINDPSFETKYQPQFPALGADPISIPLPAETRVCVSLTPAYSPSGAPPRYHYKIAAALI